MTEQEFKPGDWVQYREGGEEIAAQLVVATQWIVATPDGERRVIAGDRLRHFFGDKIYSEIAYQSRYVGSAWELSNLYATKPGLRFFVNNQEVTGPCTIQVGDVLTVRGPAPAVPTLNVSPTPDVEPAATKPEPIPMLLYCPECGEGVPGADVTVTRVRGRRGSPPPRG